jgi:hypothetical protein
MCASGTDLVSDRQTALIKLSSILPTPLRRKTPSEYELNRGHVIDCLQSDYPVLFTKEPDLSFFSPGIVLIDPSGSVRGRGLGQYGRIFGMLRFFRRAAMQDAQLTYRLVVDDAASAVRRLRQLHQLPLPPLCGPPSHHTAPHALASNPRAVVCQAVDVLPSPLMQLHACAHHCPPPFAPHAFASHPRAIFHTRLPHMSFPQIRVRWSAKLWMRDPAFGLDTFADGAPAVLHFDGVSVYELSDKGMVKAHKVDNMAVSGGENALDSLNFAKLVPSMGSPGVTCRCTTDEAGVHTVPPRK